MDYSASLTTNLFRNKIDIYVIPSERPFFSHPLEIYDWLVKNISTNKFSLLFSNLKILHIEKFCHSTSEKYHLSKNTPEFDNETYNKWEKKFGCEIIKINTIKELSQINNYHILIAPCTYPYSTNYTRISLIQYELIVAGLFCPLILDENNINDFDTPLFQPRFNKISNNDKTLGVILCPDSPKHLRYVHCESNKLHILNFLRHYRRCGDYRIYAESVDRFQRYKNFMDALEQSTEIIISMKQNMERIKFSLICFDFCSRMHFCSDSSKQVVPRELFCIICRFTIMISFAKMIY